MPKTKISEFSATPGNNTDIDGINIAEGCAPSGINDAIRELMAQLKDFQAGTAGDSFNGPVGSTTPAAGTFTNLSASGTFALTGDQVQISEGGTGQTTANAAFNALAPSQTSQAGKYLKTDGTNTSWDAIDINTADITGTLPIANGGTGLTALGTGVQTALGQNVTGSGGIVLASSPSLTTPNLGTPSAVTLTNATGLPLSTGVTGTLATTNGGTGLTSFTANGVVYASSTSALTTGSALVFDGTNLGIGASPTYKLDLSGTNPAFRLKAGAGFGYIIDQNTSSSLVSHILYENADMRWGVNSAEAMRLTSTGLGIGTSSPAAKLDVRSGATTFGAQISTSGTNTYTPTGSTSLAAANLQILGGNASGACSGMRISHSGNFELFFGAVQEAGGAGAFVWQGYSGSAYAERMRLDSSGNLGLGVTPSAWSSSFKALNIGVNGQSVSADGGQIIIGSNYVQESGGAKYVVSAAAGSYAIARNSHYWYIAPSGTAGDPISFTQAMTLDASGNFYVGTTSQSGGSNITFNQPANADMKIAASVSTGTRAAYQVFINNAVTTVGTENSTGGSLASGTAAYATVLANNGAYPICFATNNTERARITSDGALLVGSPTSDLTGTAKSIVVGNFAVQNAGSAGTFLQVVPGAANGTVDLKFDARTGAYPAATFWTSNTERARITSGGDLLVGATATTNGARFRAVGNGSYVSWIEQTSNNANSGVFIYLTGNRASNTTDLAIRYGDDVNNRFQVLANGDVQNTNNSYGAVSDVKLKENIVDASPKLADLMQVKVRNYNLIGETSKQIGVVAQELEQVFPNMVGESPDRDAEGNDLGTTTKSVKYSVFVPMLIKAIQEQQAIITDLRARVAQLEAK